MEVTKLDISSREIAPEASEPAKLVRNDQSFSANRDAFFWITLIGCGFLVPAYLVSISFGILTQLFHFLIWVHVGMLISGLAIGVAEIVRLTNSAKLPVRALMLFTSLILVATLALTFHPPVARDALTHHLYVPRIWLAHSVSKPILWHEWSYYPMLFQLPFVEPLFRNHPELCAFFHWLFLPLSGIAACFTLLERKFSAGTAIVGGCLLVLTPVCLSLATTPLVDLSLMWCCLVGTRFLWKMGDNPDAGAGKLRLSSIGAGIAFGCALSAKYNAIPFVIFALISWLLLRHKQLGNKVALWNVLITSAVALLIFSPWMFKNISKKGNPLYPQLQSYFGPKPAASEKLPGVSPLAQRRLIYGESWLEIALTPLRMILFGKDGDPKRFDGVLSPLYLVALVPFITFWSRPWWIKQSVITISLYWFTALFSTSWRVRYLAPLLPLFIFLIVSVVQSNSLKLHKVALFGIVLQCVMSSIYLFSLYNQLDPLRYILGEESKSEYYAHHIPGYSLIEKINGEWPANLGGTYLLFTQNPFYLFDGPVFSGGHRSERPLIQIIREAKSSDEIATELKRRHLARFFVNSTLAERTFKDLLTPEELNRWTDFASKSLVLKGRDGSFAWFDIVNKGVLSK